MHWTVGGIADFIVWLWLAWVIAWYLLASWQKSAARRAPARIEATQRILVMAGVVLFFWTPIRALDRQLYPVSLTLAEAALAAVLLGFLLTFWARFTLGANWSAMVMLKQGHELVHRGPYRRIRHPIYTGVLLAALATAVLNARPLPYVGFVLMLIGFAIKARAEEAILGENLAGYAGYRRSTGMFLPR